MPKWNLKKKCSPLRPLFFENLFNEPADSRFPKIQVRSEIQVHILFCVMPLQNGGQWIRVSARILFKGTAGRRNSRGVWGCPPKAKKKLNSKVSETNFGDSRVPVC